VEIVVIHETNGRPRGGQALGKGAFCARRCAPFPESRYLLPLVALFGAALALAARGAGRRWGAATSALIVVALVAHDLFSQLQVIARYYG